MPVFDKLTAKIKMRILTAPGHENVTWYNIDREQKLSQERIMEKMIGRLERNCQPLAKVTQVIQFYDNQSGVLIKQFQP